MASESSESIESDGSIDESIDTGESNGDTSGSSGADSCTIQIPDDFEEKCTFLVNFSNGQLMQSSQPPKITLYDKTKDRTKKKRVLVAETDDLTYIGTNFNSDSAALSNFNQYYIGALDRETGIMTLHRTEMITFHPHIPGSVESRVGEEISIPEEKPDRTKTVNEMVKLFGSERRKRAFSAAQKNQVESEVLETALEPAFSHAQTKSESTPFTGMMPQGSGLMPPHNQEAEAPQDVYDIHDNFRIIKDMAKELVDATDPDVEQWREERRYPEYVLQHISQLPSTEPDRSLKASMLVYASFLIELQNMNSRKVERTGVSFEGITPPAEVLEQLLDKFSEKHVGPKKTYHTLPVRIKDKIRLHLLVLCLIIEDFTVECSVLQKDLKVTTNKMMDYFRALGCVARKNPKKLGDSAHADNSCTCTLKIPLSFPKPRQAKKRKEY